jgi:hypothetical protein
MLWTMLHGSQAFSSGLSHQVSHQQQAACLRRLWHQGRAIADCSCDRPYLHPVNSVSEHNTINRSPPSRHRKRGVLQHIKGIFRGIQKSGFCGFPLFIRHKAALHGALYRHQHPRGANKLSSAAFCFFAASSRSPRPPAPAAALRSSWCCIRRRQHAAQIGNVAL